MFLASCSASTELLTIELSWHQIYSVEKTISLKLIAMFLLSFWCTWIVQLSSFSRWAVLLCRAAKKFSDFFFLNWFYLCFMPLFSGVFLNVMHYSKRMKILLYSVSFCPLKYKINSFLCIHFPRCLSHGKEKILFLVFFQVIRIKLVLFVDIF